MEKSRRFCSQSGKIPMIQERQKMAFKINRQKPNDSWCLGRELNPHSLKDRGILSPLRLPIPPPRHENLQIREAIRLILFLHCTVKVLLINFFSNIFVS